MLTPGHAGWAATLLLCVLQLRARRRLAHVARACHEVRGPLCAARLGLERLEAQRPRVTAIDLELRRAARALEDLSGHPTADRRELVDVCELARAHAPAWQAVAAAHGAELRLDVITEVPPAAAVVPLRRPIRQTREGASAGPTAAGAGAGAVPAGPPTGVAGFAAPRAPVAGSRARFAAPPAAVADRGARFAGLPAAVAGPTAVLADPLRLAQAFANLVTNAAEHGGGVVRVRVVAVGDRVRFEVADDGPGLPAPVAALAAAGRSRRSRRGHGLAVAAAVAARHDGWLTSAPAQSGARLALELPAAAPLVPARRDAAHPPEIVA